MEPSHGNMLEGAVQICQPQRDLVSIAFLCTVVSVVSPGTVRISRSLPLREDQRLTQPLVVWPSKLNLYLNMLIWVRHPYGYEA